MDVAVVYAALRAAITADATDINTWAQATYSKDHTFLTRLDRREGPQEGDCPCTDIMVLGKTMSQEERQQTSRFAITAAVHDRTASYFTNIEAYRKLLQDAVVGYVDSTDYVVIDIGVTFDSDNFFPAVICTMEFRILEHITIGQNPIE